MCDAMKNVDRPLGWNRDQLDEVSGAVPLEVLARREALDPHRSAGRMQEAEQKRDQRGLPRAVGARDADFTAAYGKRKVVQRTDLSASPERPIGFRQTP